jgi:hypothetical protein
MKEIYFGRNFIYIEAQLLSVYKLYLQDLIELNLTTIFCDSETIFIVGIAIVLYVGTP